MTLRGILFDKDGTLIDFDATWGPAAYEVMRALARGNLAKLQTLMEISHYIEAERRFLPSSPLVAGSSAHYGPVWAAALERPADGSLYREMDDLFAHWGLKTLAPIHRPANVCADLRSRGLELGIATNDAERSARLQSSALGLDPYLTYIAGYDSGFGAKPGPGMVAGFIEQIGCAPGEVTLVGDSIHDLHAARAAGALAVLVLSGPLREAARAELEPHADHVIGTIADLPDLVERLS
jgi:phosphoglycolate phosphatase